MNFERSPFFMPWEPKDNIGAGLVNAPGALCWNELATPDLGGSTEFYSELFGWSVAPFEASPEPYLMVKNGEIKIATMMSVTLSTDHRAVDGALGAELLVAFKRLIENPMGMLA